jgi:hypothetical protein
LSIGAGIALLTTSTAPPLVHFVRSTDIAFFSSTCAKSPDIGKSIKLANVELSIQTAANIVKADIVI